MKFKDLVCFLEVSNTLHFTKASENLHISQPSLSYSIKQLEIELNAELFIRDGKNVYPTEAGNTFKPYVESALNILEQGKKQIDKIKTNTVNTINIGYVYSTGSNIVTNLIENLYNSKEYKSIKCDLKMGASQEIINNILENNFDFGIIPLLEKVEGLDYIEIFTQELYLLVHENHKLRNKIYVEIKDIKDEDFIVLYEDSDLYKLTVRHFKENNLNPKLRFYVDELNSMAAFISAKMGVGISPLIPAIKNYNLKAIPFKNNLYRDIYLVWNKENSNKPEVTNLLDFLESRDGLYFLYDI